jgi:regulatory LuxR family protein
VLELMAGGLHDDAIAHRVGISTTTVRRHVTAIIDRLGVKSRFAAGAAAQRRGMDWLASTFDAVCVNGENEMTSLRVSRSYSERRASQSLWKLSLAMVPNADWLEEVVHWDPNLCLQIIDRSE